MFDSHAPLGRITGALDRADAALVEVVEGLVDARERIVTVLGLSPAVWLAAVSRLPRQERTWLLNAADVLPQLPLVRARFVGGRVSWAVVSRICARASRLSAQERTTVDARMADAIDHLAGSANAPADALLEILHELLAQLRADRERARERRRERGEFLAMQPFLDGTGGSLYGEFGAVHFATIADAVADAAPAAEVEPNPHGDPRVASDNRASIGNARAAGLVALCSRTADGEPRQPKFLATVAMETLLGLQRTNADLLTRLVGGRLRLTATAARRLADGGGDLRLVVHDRQGRTIGVGRQERIPPGWLRDATLAFHAVCSCPGCNLPARECDLDHAREWRDRGRTDAANLHPVHRGRHGQKTARQWTVTRHPDQSTTWTHARTGIRVTQPSLWAVKALATGTHPTANRRSPP